MSQELLYTSAPRGLKPGSSGFCTVMSTQGMPANLAQRLEALSGYRHVFAPHDPQAALNPIAWSHLKLMIGGRRYHVLSRVAAAGLDHTQRNNKLAHHVVLDAVELPAAGPAWLLSQPGFMETSWDGIPKVVPTGRKPPLANASAVVCRAWNKVTGDAGWGGVLAETAIKGTGGSVTLIFRPGMDLLALIAESLALLPPERRWDVTFSTYFTGLPPGIDCQWRCLLDGTPEVDAPKRSPLDRMIDFCSPLGRPPNGAYVKAARNGTLFAHDEDRSAIANEIDLVVHAGSPSLDVAELNEPDEPIELGVAVPPPLPTSIGGVHHRMPPDLPPAYRSRGRWRVAAGLAAAVLIIVFGGIIAYRFLSVRPSMAAKGEPTGNTWPQGSNVEAQTRGGVGSGEMMPEKTAVEATAAPQPVPMSNEANTESDSLDKTAQSTDPHRSTTKLDTPEQSRDKRTTPGVAQRSPEEQPSQAPVQQSRKELQYTSLPDLDDTRRTIIYQSPQWSESNKSQLELLGGNLACPGGKSFKMQGTAATWDCKLQVERLGNESTLCNFELTPGGLSFQWNSAASQFASDAAYLKNCVLKLGDSALALRPKPNVVESTLYLRLLDGDAECVVPETKRPIIVKDFPDSKRVFVELIDIIDRPPISFSLQPITPVECLIRSQPKTQDGSHVAQGGYNLKLQLGLRPDAQGRDSQFTVSVDARLPIKDWRNNFNAAVRDEKQSINNQLTHLDSGGFLTEEQKRKAKLLRDREAELDKQHGYVNNQLFPKGDSNKKPDEVRPTKKLLDLQVRHFEDQYAEAKRREDKVTMDELLIKLEEAKSLKGLVEGLIDKDSKARVKFRLCTIIEGCEVTLYTAGTIKAEDPLKEP